MTTTNITLREFISRPDELAKFVEILGDQEARAYVQSVIIAANATDDLRKCTPASVTRAALRAASLGLSCDPALKQAQLVPFPRKIKAQGEKPEYRITEAQFQPHYLGLYTLASRTGKYFFLNVTAVYQGQRVLEAISGLHYIEVQPGLVADTNQADRLFSKGYRDVTGGKPILPVVGFVGYYKKTNGFEHSVYMTVEEIEEHAKKFSKSYKNPSSLWHHQYHKQTMQMKTVLRQLLNWADLSGKAAQAVMVDSRVEEGEEPVGEDDFIEGAFSDVPAEATPEAPTQPQDASADDMGQIDHPLNPVTLRALLAKQAKQVGIYRATPDQVGLMNAMMEQAFAPDKDADKIRRSCIKYLWGVVGSSLMSGPSVKATLAWLNPTKDDGGAYFPNPVAVQELHGVWTAANIEAGQVELPLSKGGAE